MNSATTNAENTSGKNTAAISEADRPTNVVFFDGVCGLCNCFVDFVLSRDHRGAIRFAPLQGETAKLRSNARDTNFNTMIWTDELGRDFLRSAAAVRVLRQLGGLWWFIGWLLWLIPLPLRDLGYRIIAANRYRLFGKTETCRMPTPAERTRFLPLRPTSLLATTKTAHHHPRELSPMETG